MITNSQRCFVILAIWAAISADFPVSGAGEESSDALYTSPGGTLRIEADGDEAVVVSTKNPSQQAKLPKESADSEVEDEFHASPDEQWIFALYHVGSGMRNGNLYQRLSPAKFDRADSFNANTWKSGVKLGALKQDYFAAGVCEMTFFVCWSWDSSRLLIELAGGDERRDMFTPKHHGVFYFNTRTKTFEITDYLRAVNKLKDSTMLRCAEPSDPLPDVAGLQKRFDVLDRQLNKSYGERIARTQKDQVAAVRDSQRAWIKKRDEGLEFYLKVASPVERKSRKLQFLGDVTAARIDVLNSADFL
ncbi:MAG: lysozyme inhibitor LprI family protein [Chthoniobacteraceae bacterium]